MTQQRTWRTEFSEKYNPGGAIQTLVESGILTDSSAGNDTCPSFTRWRNAEHDEDTPRVVLWVEHPDPDSRENASPRFTVIAYASDNSDPDILVAADIIEVAIAVLMAHRWAAAPANKAQC